MAAQTQASRPSTLSPFAHSAFLWLWLTSLSSNLSTAIQSVGASWIMTGLSGHADMVALIQTAMNLPITLFALIGGAMADLHDRARIMLICQLAMGLIATSLTMLALEGLMTPWLLLGLTFALGMGIAFYNPCVQASVGQLVPRAELAGAVTLQILGFNVARSVGPAIGGLIVASAGSPAAFVVTALGYFGAVTVLLVRKPVGHAPARPLPRPSLGQAIGIGLRHVAKAPEIRTVLIRAAAFTLLGSAAWALMPLIARDLIQGGPRQYGLLLGALGLGGMLGGTVSHAIRMRFTAERIIQGAGVIYGLACLIVALRPGLWASFFVLVIGGAGWVQALSGFSVTGQLWSPRAVVGRVAATINTVIYGGLALGSWGWGHVVDAIGIAPALMASGTAMLLLPLLGLLMPLPRHEDAPDQSG